MRAVKVIFLLILSSAWVPAMAGVPLQTTEFWTGLVAQEVEIVSDGPIRRIPLAEIESLAGIKTGQPISSSLIRTSIQRLHSTGLFYDVQAEIQPTSQNQARVRLILIRRYFVDSVNFDGDVALDRSLLRRMVTVRPGEAFSNQRMNESLGLLKEFYAEQGYYLAHLEASYDIDENESRLNVRFVIDAGPRAQVNVLNVDADPGVDLDKLEALMVLREAGPYSEQQLETDLLTIQTWLASQGYLDALVFTRRQPSYVEATNGVTIDLRIAPGDRTVFTFEGDPLDESQTINLPVFEHRSISPVFVEETEEVIKEELQLEGFLRSSVESEIIQLSDDRSRVTFRVQKGEKLALKSLNLEGTDLISREVLLNLAECQPPGLFRKNVFSDRQASQDAERIGYYLQQRGYLDAKISWRLEDSGPGKVDLIFSAVEGPQFVVDKLEIEGASQVAEERIREKLVVSPGAPFRPLEAATDRAVIVALYEDLGYRNISFRSRIIRREPNLIDLKYLIDEGTKKTVSDVIVIGNLTTKSSVIQREIAIEPSQPLSQGQILQTENQLYELGVFRRVQITEVPSFSDPSSQTVLIRLQEANRYNLFYGFGYSSFEGPRGTVGLTDSNFRGKATSLTLSLRAGERRQRAAVSYSFPRFLGKRLPSLIAFSGDNEFALTRNVGGSTYRSRPYDSLKLTGLFQTAFTLAQRESLLLRYQYQLVRLDVPPDLQLEFFREENVRLSSVALAYLNDSRDDVSDPSRGFLIAPDIQVAPAVLGSGEELIRFFGQGVYYRPLGLGLVWSSSLRLGAITPFGKSQEVPISEKFFSGGSGTLRGIPQDLAGPLLRDEDGNLILVDRNGNRVEEGEDGRPVPIGGEGLLVFNTEIRYPIYRFLRGALFYDVGTVYEKLSDFPTVGVNHAVGLGLLIDTPVGPFRVDLGYNPNPPDIPGFEHWNFFFTLGHPF